MLVAASRADHPQHVIARDWLEEAAAEAARGASLVLLPMVVAGVLRIVTHDRIFPDPTPPRSAVAFVRALLALPGVDMVTIGDEWPAVEQLCLEHRLRGNDVTDAWIAAAIIDHHERLVTFDRGFRRLLPKRQLTILKP